MKNMKTASFYILTLLTGGQFAMPWLFLMASQANANNSLFHPKLKQHAVIFSIVYCIYLSFIFYGMYQFINNHGASILQNSIVFTSLLCISIGLLWYTGALLFKIAGYIRAQTIDLPSNTVLILLVFIYAAAFPLLQSKLNRTCTQSV